MSTHKCNSSSIKSLDNLSNNESFITQLPDEMLLNIFLAIINSSDLNNLSDNISNLRLVNKKFNNFLKPLKLDNFNLPHLIPYLKEKSYMKKISENMIKVILQKQLLHSKKDL